MTFIVKKAATLRLADGGSFDLTPGMHDDFPAAVKNHWAFAAYAEPVDTTRGDADKKGAAAAKQQIKQLQGYLVAKADELATKELKISEQMGEIGALKTRITELEALAVEADQLKARITELEGQAAEAVELKARIAELEKPATEGEKKDAKKQSATDS
ncbi:hypothetical protein AAY84_07480 [Serratia marcescens]|uniref:STY1053 family phage-associated protein n=1 Tax=Serratia marcescens TaxID=615 RepID=UPI00062C7C10|nr:hypothetical protein [Serratia marcescens]KKZ19020.1 hypothetical protein AAY84_07480 [Serratia marcescens]